MNIPLLTTTAAFFVALIVVCMLPVGVEWGDDGGDGRTRVLIPSVVKTPSYRPRTWALIAMVLALGLLFLGLQRPSLSGAYSSAVRAVSTAITNDPVRVNGYINRLRPAVEFFA